MPSIDSWTIYMSNSICICITTGAVVFISACKESITKSCWVLCPSMHVNLCLWHSFSMWNNSAHVGAFHKNPAMDRDSLLNQGKSKEISVCFGGPYNQASCYYLININYILDLIAWDRYHNILKINFEVFRSLTELSAHLARISWWLAFVLQQSLSYALSRQFHW